MKTTFILLCLFIILFSKAQIYSLPESAEYDVIHQRYIVSNRAINNLQTVIPGNPPTLFVSGVPTPYSLVIVGDTVYVVCNGSHLQGYNLTTGAQAFDINLGSTFLKGICTDFAGNLFITDFTARKVLRYNIATQQFNYFVNSMSKQPNGIVYDPFHNRCVIATWGTNASILGLSLLDSTITILKTTTLSNIDGITIDEDGNFYATDWGSDGIYFFDSAFANAPLKVVSSLNNPAHISYNTLSDTIAVPNNGNSTVTFYGFLRPQTLPDFDTVNVYYSKTICVLQNDAISTNVPLVLKSFSSPELGTAFSSTNCIHYTATNEGTDTISYIVCSVDTPSYCRTGYLYITNILDSNNLAPVAENDVDTTAQGNALAIRVADNDVDAFTDTLCITSMIGSAFFSLDTINCGNIIFTPDSFFIGNDTAIYIVCDNGIPVLCDTASLVVTVVPYTPLLSSINIWHMFQNVCPVLTKSPPNDTRSSNCNYQWNYTYPPMYFTSGDTVINSFHYKLVFSGGGNSCFYGFIREDKGARKVYFMDNLGNAEVLLYDFSMMPGDTIRCNFFNAGSWWGMNFNDGTYRLDSIKTDYLGSANRKTFYLNNIDTPSTTLIWHEGLGSVIHPFYLYMQPEFGCIWFGDCGYPHSYPFNNNSFVTCYEHTAQVYFDSCAYAQALLSWCIAKPNVCDYYNICGAIEKLSSVSAFVISPNPAYDNIVVELEVKKNTTFAIIVRDLQGREIIEEKKLGRLYEGKHNTIISLPDLSSGVYFIGCKTEEGTLYRKLIIQR